MPLWVDCSRKLVCRVKYIFKSGETGRKIETGGGGGGGGREN